MPSCKSKSLYDTTYNQEFKTRMLAAGWTHLNDIYEFEAFRSVHRKESLIMVVPVPLPLVPSMMTIDLGAYSVVASMPTRFQYATTGLYFRETLSGNSFGGIRHMNEDGWFEQYAILGQIHKEAQAIAYESTLATEASTEEQTYDSRLTANGIDDMVTSFAYVQK